MLEVFESQHIHTLIIYNKHSIFVSFLLNKACDAKDDFSPFSGDCSKFLRCDQNRFVQFACNPPTLWDYKRKLCDSPNNVLCYDPTYQVQVWNGNQSYSINATYTFNSSLTPIITSLFPLKGTSGDLLTIYGQNFGTNQTNLLVNIGPSLSCSIIDLTNTQINCRLPNSSGGIVSVVVTVYDLGSSNSKPFEYAFSLTGVSITQGGLGGGNNLTINGSGFSNNTKVFICNLECSITEFVSTIQIVCLIPASQARLNNVRSFCVYHQ